MSTCAVIGAGAIGGYVGAQLAWAGHQVTFCVRTPFEHLLLDMDGREQAVEAAVVTEPREVAAADWVLLATKAHQTPAAAAWLNAARGPHTRAVVVLQNGVEHRERVAPFVGETPVLPAVVMCAAEVLAPGHVVHHGSSLLQVPAGELGDAFAALLAVGNDRAGTRLRVERVADFAAVAWRKLVSNAVAGPVTALTGQRLTVFTQPQVARLGAALAEECLAVAAAAGARLDIEEARRLIASLGTQGASMGTSMLYDRRAGRMTEHEAITGAVVRAGERHQVPTPLNRAMLALLSA